MDALFVPIIGILASLVGLPGIVLYFVFRMRKDKNEVEKLRLKREILELELRKEESTIKALEQENRRLDRLID